MGSTISEGIGYTVCFDYGTPSLEEIVKPRYQMTSTSNVPTAHDVPFVALHAAL